MGSNRRMRDRKPPDPELIARYMSPAAAQGVFEQRMNDIPPGFIGSGGRGGGFTERDLQDMRWNPPTQQQRLDAAWNGLRHAENVSEQTDAVMVLSEMIFGDTPPERMPRQRRDEVRNWGGQIARVISVEEV